jgi:hypothetical protein
VEVSGLVLEHDLQQKLHHSFINPP